MQKALVFFCLMHYNIKMETERITTPRSAVVRGDEEDFCMKILVINAGSSSIKYQLIDMETEQVLAKGLCDRIGIAGGNFKHKVEGREDYKLDVQMKNHAEAVQLVLDTLVSPEHGVIKSLSEISAVGHRVLHGGEKFSGSVVIDEKVIATIEECCELGPLHNPHNLTGIRACEKLMPGVPQVAVFDTGFHQTMPDYAYLYALPYEYYEKYHIRRYGFHGTSHRYVSMRAAEMLGKKPEELRIVTCHLGNGSSLAAIKDGKVVDTSMGFTPLDGIIMGTRCGSIDPSIVSYIANLENLHERGMNRLLNNESGLLGVSGVSSDFRDVLEEAENGNERAQLAADMLEYQLVKLIGSYAAALGGVDAILFTGGIGENAMGLREQVMHDLAYLGVTADLAANNSRGEEVRISGADSKVEVWVVPTNEEIMIARDTAELIK